MEKKKPKVAFFDLTGCNGCLYSVLNHPAVLNIPHATDLQQFRLASDMEPTGSYDVAVIEGYAAIQEEIEMLKEIQEEADKLVALGSCASYGSIHSIQNFMDVEDAKRAIYSDHPEHIETPHVAVSIGNYVDLDLKIPGCPPNADEVVELLGDLVMGKEPPELREWPVCVDCKLRGNECVLIHGIPCLGPVTRGGCGAPCPESYTCDGCRGPREDPNLPSLLEQLEELLSKEAIKRFFKRYASSSKEFKKVIEGEIHARES